MEIIENPTNKENPHNLFWGIKAKLSDAQWYINMPLLEKYSVLVKKLCSGNMENVDTIKIHTSNFWKDELWDKKYVFVKNKFHYLLAAVICENSVPEDPATRSLDLSSYSTQDMTRVMSMLNSYHNWPQSGYYGGSPSYSWANLNFFDENITFEQLISMLGLMKTLDLEGYKKENDYTWSLRHVTPMLTTSIASKIINKNTAIEIWYYLEANKKILPGAAYFRKQCKRELYGELMEIFLAPLFDYASVRKDSPDDNKKEVTVEDVVEAFKNKLPSECPCEHKEKLVKTLGQAFGYMMRSTY